MASKSTRDTGTFSFTVEPLELKNLFSLLSALPKEVQAEVRDSAQVMSKRLAGQLMQFGLASRTPQAKLVIESILTPRDRLIRVDIGGTKRVGRKYGGKTTKGGKRTNQKSAPAGSLLWGSEYDHIPALTGVAENTQTDLKHRLMRAVIGLRRLLIFTRLWLPKNTFQWFKQLSKRID